ncbi:hypothetical protein [Roseomonas elaeocarpi]|uniref:Uncharacterized protein n=1 Tax=Roseomonas elaeocarpi TaxID=907779 RepID=A0ABV6JYT1_9PROT
MSRAPFFPTALLGGTALAVTLGLGLAQPASAMPAAVPPAAAQPGLNLPVPNLPEAVLPVQYRDWVPRDAWGRPLPPPPPRDWRWRRDHDWYGRPPPPRAYYAPPPPPPPYYGYGRPHWGY